MMNVNLMLEKWTDDLFYAAYPDSDYDDEEEQDINIDEYDIEEERTD